MRQRIDAATLLGRALVGDAACAGISSRIVATSTQRWASATFVGARHRITLESARCAAIEPWLASLPDADLPLRGHLVADLVVVDQLATDHITATLEILTVEAA